MVTAAKDQGQQHGLTAVKPYPSINVLARDVGLKWIIREAVLRECFLCESLQKNTKLGCLFKLLLERMLSARVGFSSFCANEIMLVQI